MLRRSGFWYPVINRILLGSFEFLQTLHRKSPNTLIAFTTKRPQTLFFALPVLYRPESFIPKNIWRACPATTNGNEQTHRNVNRDGVSLILLGGIMRGRAFDDRAVQSVDVHTSSI
ncbi:hypothetical protein EV702DRAFT_1128194 [Suillus placidus]|uniref:Uncharacterized protein n=1 Tax=Suillus placidus TaxID=48579 RepID=A0A9P6ZPE6_9AGAM|nr:hypothetical protein EV702DRAFT_1128194 [Suillus placidus]